MLQHISALTLASRPTLSTPRKLISFKRQGLAAACKLGEYIALEAKDDAEGFCFWLAQTCAPGSSWKYSGNTMKKNGVTFKNGGLSHPHVLINMRMKRFVC